MPQLPALAAPTFLGRLGLACLLAWPLVAQAAQAVSEPPPASTNAFIVRLKDAPGHRALAPLPGRQNALAVQEQARWAGVLQATGLSGAGLRPVGRDMQLLRLPRALPAGEAQALRERLARHPAVAWAEPDAREKRQNLPNDPYFPGASGQWWLHPHGGSNANAPAERLRGVPGFQRAWLRQTGSPGAVVAVLDTGITNHPDLAGRVLPGYDFVSEVHFANDGNGRDADPADPGDWVSAADLANRAFDGCAVENSSWHGTVIATQVAANTNEGVGVAGASWNGRVLPVRVAGKCGAALSDIIDGMRWAAGLPVEGVPDNPNPSRIINISFGGSQRCGSAYQEAVDELRREKGAVVIAAAGNEWGAPTRPASCVGTVGVVALNRDGFKSNYSNFGSALAASGIATVGGDDADGRWGAELADPGLVAGSNEGSAQPGASGYFAYYGTSFAAPVVAGAVSLMLSANPALTYEQILAGLRLGARPHVAVPAMAACSADAPGRCACSTATCGVGILDIEQSLTYAENPSSYVPPAWSPEVVDTAEVRRAVALGADRAPNPQPEPETGGGGGGAMSLAWVALLALAATTLHRHGRRA